MSIGSTGRESARNAILERRIRELERRTDRIPSRWGGGSSTSVYFYVSCLDGNLLFTVAAVNYYGVKRPATAITEVPTLTPSATAGALPDGLSRGLLLANNGTSTTVWIGLRLKPGIWSGGIVVPGAVTYDDYVGAIPNGNAFMSRNKVRVPVTASVDTYADVYNPWRI
jgi:hypothetical protein